MYQFLYFFFLCTLLSVNDLLPLSAKKTVQNFSRKHQSSFLVFLDQASLPFSSSYFSNGINKFSYRHQNFSLHLQHIIPHFSFCSSLYNRKFFCCIINILLQNNSFVLLGTKQDFSFLSHQTDHRHIFSVRENFFSTQNPRLLLNHQHSFIMDFNSTNQFRTQSSRRNKTTNTIILMFHQCSGLTLIFPVFHKFRLRSPVNTNLLINGDMD